MQTMSIPAAIELSLLFLSRDSGVQKSTTSRYTLMPSFLLLTILGLAALTAVPVGPVPKASGLSADFALSAFPSSLTLGQGATSSSTVTVTGRGGYQGNVSLSIAEVYDSLHVGVQPRPSLVELNTTHQSANSILTISVSAYAVSRSYFIDVESFDGVVSHQTQRA